MKSVGLKFILILCLSWSWQALAQQSILPDQPTDDTLPIANQRFDNTVEPPKENFTSAHHDDMWEKYERGDMDEQEYARWQGKSLPNETNVATHKKVFKKESAREVASFKKLNKASHLKTKNKTKLAKKTLKKKRIPTSLPKKLPLKQSGKSNGSFRPVN